MTDAERKLLTDLLLFYWGMKDQASARKAAERVIKDFEKQRNETRGK
jgi:alkylhydroperoxidase/carboxymuconolactone decarboxylase family protein YurZ